MKHVLIYPWPAVGHPMKQAVNQFTTIARLTFVESARQPIGLLILTTTLVLITLLPFVITHSLEGIDKLVLDSALATHWMAGLFLGGYLSCTALVREFGKGTAAAILSKPVNRGLFFLAKFAGVAFYMVLFSLAAFAATLISVRAGRTAEALWRLDWWAGGPLLAAPCLAAAGGIAVNLFQKRPFVSAAFGYLLAALGLAVLVTATLDIEGRPIPFASALPLEIWPASLLIGLAVLLLTALSASLATRLDVVPTLSLVFGLLLVGLLSDHLFLRPAMEGHAVAGVLYRLVPNWQHFWAADTIGRDTWEALQYGTIYLAGLLCLGVFAFRAMEVK
jgi:hypothetical protein